MKRLCAILLCGTALGSATATAQPTEERVEGAVRPDGTIAICDRVFRPDQTAELVGAVTFCPASDRALSADLRAIGSVGITAQWEPYGIPPPPPPPPPPTPRPTTDATVAEVTSVLRQHNFSVVLAPQGDWSDAGQREEKHPWRPADPAWREEIVYSTLPVLLGEGIRFFEGIDTEIDLHLLGAQACKNGRVEMRNEVRR